MDKQLVVFKVCDKEYGLEIDQVNQIITPIETYKIPDAPKYIEGIISLRDTVYPLINTRIKLGLPVKETDENTRIIIIDNDGIKVGLVVDEANDIISVSESELASPSSDPTNNETEFVKEIAKRGDQNILMLDLNKFLDL